MGFSAPRIDAPAWLGRLSAVVAVAGAIAAFVALRGGQRSASALGYVEAIHHSVGPIAAGRVAAIDVQLGQRVKAGDPIARMDDKALQLTRARAVALLDRARATVTATAQEEDFQVTRSELWVLKARADERGDRAELDEITTRMDRLEGLLQQNMIAATEAEATRVRLKNLAARIETYNQAARRGQAGLQQRGAGDHEHRAAIDVQVAPARLAVEVQEATVRQLDRALEELTVRAPVDGTVTVISHRAGDVVTAGTEIVSLVSTRPGMVVAIVPEQTAATFAPNAELRRKDRVFGPTLHGKVVEVAPEIDEVPPRARPSPGIPAWGRRVVIQVTGSAEELLPGEAWNVTFH